MIIWTPALRRQIEAIFYCAASKEIELAFVTAPVSPTIVIHLLCYRAWPEFARVNQKWESVVESLFDVLSDKEIIYSKVNRGQWLLIEDAIFNQVTERHLKELLESVLLGANVPVVSVPSHVMDAIRSFTDVKNITASVTREELKKAAACYRNLMRHEKLRLLQFCLQDYQYEDLCDLELLPLSNGTFTTFSALAHEIYISSPEHSQDLLPGLEHRFLDRTLDPDIIRKLNCAAKQGQSKQKVALLGDSSIWRHLSIAFSFTAGKLFKIYDYSAKFHALFIQPASIFGANFLVLIGFKNTRLYVCDSSLSR